MSMTEKQIKEYRRKLMDGTYMERAINGTAEIFLKGYAMVKLPYGEPDAEPETNNTEEKEMAKNTLQDVSDHLIEQIEWLMDRDDIKGAALTDEIRRTEAVVKASEQVVNIANTFIKAKALVGNAGGKIKLPELLEDKSK
jgi:hypothetical protein